MGKGCCRKAVGASRTRRCLRRLHKVASGCVTTNQPPVPRRRALEQLARHGEGPLHDGPKFRFPTGREPFSNCRRKGGHGRAHEDSGSERAHGFPAFSLDERRTSRMRAHSEAVGSLRRARRRGPGCRRWSCCRRVPDRLHSPEESLSRCCSRPPVRRGGRCNAVGHCADGGECHDVVDVVSRKREVRGSWRANAEPAIGPRSRQSTTTPRKSGSGYFIFSFFSVSTTIFPTT